VVIFTIYIPYLAVLDLERQAPVARDVQAPDALALAGELVSLPERKDPQRFRVFHILQKSEHCAEFVHSVGRLALASVRSFVLSIPLTVARNLTPFNGKIQANPLLILRKELRRRQPSGKEKMREGPKLRILRRLHEHRRRLIIEAQTRLLRDGFVSSKDHGG
jgi:hypothetical protein